MADIGSVAVDRGDSYLKAFLSYLSNHNTCPIHKRSIGIDIKTCRKVVIWSQPIICQNSYYAVDCCGEIGNSLGYSCTILTYGSLQDSLVRYGLDWSRAESIDSMVFTAFGADLAYRWILSDVLRANEQQEKSEKSYIFQCHKLL